jgi:uncharacterized protein (TIGR03067 family)
LTLCLASAIIVLAVVVGVFPGETSIMKLKVLFWFVLPTLLAADGASPAKKELAKLAGSWSMAELHWNGKDMTGNPKVAFRFVFKDDVVIVEGSDAVRKEYARLKVKIDPTTTPKIMDFTVAAGVQKDAVLEGIYELKGDQLRICAKVFGQDRPGEFASPEGSSIVLLTLKRQAP